MTVNQCLVRINPIIFCRNGFFSLIYQYIIDNRSKIHVFLERHKMNDKIVRFNVRMPLSTAKVFNTFAALLGYKKSTFIFACAVDGLLLKVGRKEYIDMVLALSGDLLPEPSVDAEQTTEG